MTNAVMAPTTHINPRIGGATMWPRPAQAMYPTGTLAPALGPNPDKCLIVLVLDRSGSMQAGRDDTVGALNAFLASQKILPGEAYATLVQFDTLIERVFSSVPIVEVPWVDLEPRGMTALYDAIGYTLSEVDAELHASPISERPGRVFFVVITDGEENSSRRHNSGAIRERVTERRLAGWDFVFIGADIDAYAAGGQAGFLRNQTVSVSNRTREGVQHTYAALTSSIGSSRRTGEALNFTDEEKNLAEGTVTP